MFSFFKKSPPPPEVIGAAYAKNTRISYDSELIESFEYEHKVLMTLMKKMNKTLAQPNFSASIKLLRKFTHIFRSHLLTKNLRLYIYLQHTLESDEASIKIIKQFKRDGHAMGRMVNHFYNKYNKHELSNIEKKIFPVELQEMQAIVIENMAKEGTILYPMYVNPKAYS